MELTAEAIREVEFREKLRGYHPDDVDAFVERVAATVAELTQRLNAAHTTPSVVGDEEVSEETIRRTLLMAQRTADLVVSEARESAARLVADAQAAAEAAVAASRASVQKEEEDARVALQAELTRLESARAQLQQDVETLDVYLQQQRARLRDALLEQLDLVEEGGTHRLDPVPPIHDVSALVAELGRPAEEEGSAGVEGAAEAAEVAEGEERAGGAGEASADVAEGQDFDMFARGGTASRMPAAGEDDPFLDELRRAVDEPSPPVDQLASAMPADAFAVRREGREAAVTDELRGMPEGRLAGRLFRRR